MTALRLGSVHYLNARPLVAWFESPDCPHAPAITLAPPAELAAMLRAGLVDAALASTFEMIRAPGLVALPGVSISARAEVQSVRLFSKLPVPRVRTVALDSSSLSSAALTRIVLADAYGLNPTYVSMGPDLAAMLEVCDAALLIGDLSLFEDVTPHVLDLGRAWYELTGLPFVYGAWLARDDRDFSRISEVVLLAKEWGMRHLEPIASEWSLRTGMAIGRVRRYLADVMWYDLGPAHWLAITEFQRRCAAHGLAPAGVPLRGAEERQVGA